MKNIHLLCFSVLLSSLFLSAPKIFADVPESQRREVLHLLDFVISTDCSFERNGSKHSGEEAYKHIKRKYEHFKNKITSTEEFVEYSATKSTVSGKEYLVYCETDAPVTSKDWLLDELGTYRNNGAM